MLLLIIVVLLLVATGAIIGQNNDANQSPSVPDSLNAGDATDIGSASQNYDSENDHGNLPLSESEKIEGYKYISSLIIRTIPVGMNNLHIISLKIPTHPNAPSSTRKLWEEEVIRAAGYIKGYRQAILDIKNIPPSCSEAHLLLLDVAHKADVFRETFISHVPAMKAGVSSPEVDQRERELQVSISTCEAALRKL